METKPISVVPPPRKKRKDQTDHSEGGAATFDNSISGWSTVDLDEDLAEQDSVRSARDTHHSASSNDDLMIVKHTFKASDPRQLTIEQGDLLSVKQKHNNGWWECVVLATNEAGWVPGAYLKPAPKTVLMAHEGVSQVLSDHAQVVPTRESELSPEPSSTINQPSFAEPELCIAKHEYTTDHPKQLPLEKGQIVEVLAKEASGWWHVQIREPHQAMGQDGWVPQSYLEPFSQPENRTMPEVELVEFVRDEGKPLGIGLGGGKVKLSHF